jgi:hypothetical protein
MQARDAANNNQDANETQNAQKKIFDRFLSPHSDPSFPIRMQHTLWLRHCSTLEMV